MGGEVMLAAFAPQLYQLLADAYLFVYVPSVLPVVLVLMSIVPRFPPEFTLEPVEGRE